MSYTGTFLDKWEQEEHEIQSCNNCAYYYENVDDGIRCEGCKHNVCEDWEYGERL